MGTSNAGSTDFTDAAPVAEAPQEMAVSKTLRDLNSAGKALPSPEEELQAILDTSQDGIVLVDADRRILRINKAIAETSGYTEQEIRGKPLDALISPQNLPRVFSLINMSLSGLPTQSLEVDDGAGSDGKPSLEVQVSTLRRDDQIVGAAITTRNAVDRRTKTEAKQLNEDRFRNLIENTSDWVWEVNAKCVYTYVNPRVRDPNPWIL